MKAIQHKSNLKCAAVLLLGIMMTCATVKAQDQDTPCLPVHGESDNQPAWCGSIQTIQLTEGWNSISIYINADDSIAMLNLLKAGLGEYGLTIINDEGYTDYEDGEWFGDLDDIGVTNKKSYDILVSDSISFDIQGSRTNPTNYVITITPGWNYIGYPCTEEVEIAAALATFEAEEGDMIVTLEGSTAFEGGEWFGDFETFLPGQGYLYLSQSDETKTLTFSTGAKARRVKPKK